MDFLPRAYQRPIIDLFADRHRINVFASPGTGKTSATLAALDTMVVLGEEVLPALVTAPLRVANSVWDTEVGRWARFRGLRVAKIIGNADQRRAAMNQHADIYVTNYENLVWLRNELGTKWPFKTVVADESTRIKGHRTHIRPHPSDPTREVLYRGGSKGATALASRAPQTDFWINLTGTPAPNGLSDLWGQQWVLDFGKALGRTHTQFMERYYKLAHGSTRTMPKWEILDHSTDIILDAIKPNTITIDAYDWFDVERPVNLDYPVRLTPKLAAQYSEMHSNSWLELEDGNTAEGVNIGSKIMKCRQISAGGLRTDNGDWQTLHTLKLDALEEIVEKLNGAPLLVAYHFKHDIKLIQSRFKHAMILPTGARQKKVEDDWNKGKIKMLLVHPQCVGADTEVLTEFRGWQRIVDVSVHDRVHDGEEFVAHSGCVSSGVKEVVTKFGITATPDHRFLAGTEWRMFKDVCTTEKDSIQVKWRSEPTESGSEMSSMRRDEYNLLPKLQNCSGRTARAMRQVPLRRGTPHDRREAVQNMERDEGALRECKLPGLPTLRRVWYSVSSAMGDLRRILVGHAGRICGQPISGSSGQPEGIQQGELQVGDGARAAGKQTNQPTANLQRQDVPPERPVAKTEHEQRSADGGTKEGANPRGSRSPLPPQSEEVYDLVDCGKRTRYLVRNKKGEMFISHNSAGHGLNLQYGGNNLCVFTPDWNAEYYAQVIERIGPTRQAQAGLKRLTYVHHIYVAGTWDELIIKRLQGKLDVEATVKAAMALTP